MMTWKFLMVLPLIFSATAIKVSVSQEDSTEIVKKEELDKKRPIYYESDNTNVDSYLIPPNPHKQEESISDVIATPATYLLPPLPDLKSDYYIPTEPAIQTDWYPILQALPKTKSNLFLNQPKDISLGNSAPLLTSSTDGSGTKAPLFKIYAGELDDPAQFNIPIPSRQLEPPPGDVQSQFYIPTPAAELELPLIDTKHQLVVPVPATNLELPTLDVNKKFNPLVKKVPVYFNRVEPTLALHLIPPTPITSNKYKNPTKLYPKKYANGFKPIPIPITQFTDSDNPEIQKSRPVKPTKSAFTSEEDYQVTPVDEKKIYLYEQADQKRKYKEEGEARKQQEVVDTDVEQPFSIEVPEQETSGTSYRRPLPVHQSEEVEQDDVSDGPPAPKDRTEFRMHGMKGPHSYQFGYDTGKGKNRQFRYEERDNDGHVRGHYGYMDRSGKLRVVNYDAHPEHGFHAEGP